MQADYAHGIVPNAMHKTDREWGKELTPEQYHILREKGTEPPFSGEYVKINEKGMYTCVACGNELFSSDTKFDSGCGWPSFYAAVAPDRVTLQEDMSAGMMRMEVLCGNCAGHLGHVFDDGPSTLPDGRQATGKRFCINSVALRLNKSQLGQKISSVENLRS